MRISLRRRISALCCLTLLTLIAAPAKAATPSLGIFQDHADVGTVLHPGSVEYDPAQQTYTISGSGANMWFGEDDFHYLWTKVSGDVSLTADITFVGATGNNHRKAVLMIRQSLDANSPAVDLAWHGDGLTSLQYRDAPGANTHEVESNISAPRTVRIEKRGDYFYAFVSGSDGKLQASGASTKLALTGPFYIGIGVCAHDKDVTEKAVFSNVKLVSLAPATGKPVLYSALETITVASTDRRVAYVAPIHFEAPNWSRDGSFFLFNSEGKLYRVALNGSEPTAYQHRSAKPLQQRPRHFTRRPVDGHQLPVRKHSRLVHLRCADQWWNAPADHAVFAVLLAWMVARRENVGLRRPAMGTSISIPFP